MPDLGKRLAAGYRGDGSGRPDDLPLPPRTAPLLNRWRLRKHWRYVGFFSADHLVCAARVHVGPVAQEFWGVWDRDGRVLHEHTRLRAGRVRLPPGRVLVADRGAELDLALDEDPSTAFEVVTPVGRAWTWTRKQLVPARGTFRLDGREHRLEGHALVDDNDGYHPRLTRWWWSGGTALVDGGRTVSWSVIVGLNDTLPDVENTLWVDGVPRPLGPVVFAPDLSWVRFADGRELRFHAEAERAKVVDLLVIRSAYRQPFGTFTGTLPGGLVVEQAWGVMEQHRALW